MSLFFLSPLLLGQFVYLYSKGFNYLPNVLFKLFSPFLYFLLGKPEGTVSCYPKYNAKEKLGLCCKKNMLGYL